MILLDTCALLWIDNEPSRFSQHVKKLFVKHSGAIFVSAISAFEIALKHRKKKLTLPMPPFEWYSLALDFHGLREVPVNGTIAILATELPMHHCDPCDRIIIATAMKTDCRIVTPDTLIHQYSEVKTVW